MNTQTLTLLGLALVAGMTTAGSAIAGVAVPAPAAGLLGMPGWLALGAGYAGFLVVRYLRSRK